MESEIICSYACGNQASLLCQCNQGLIMVCTICLSIHFALNRISAQIQTPISAVGYYGNSVCEICTKENENWVSKFVYRMETQNTEKDYHRIKRVYYKINLENTLNHSKCISLFLFNGFEDNLGETWFLNETLIEWCNMMPIKPD